MKLYHYTGEHHIAGIQRSGLVHGAIPVNVHMQTIYGHWLTDDPDWEAQRWATQINLDCDRTAARFLVSIPKSRRGSLYRWDDFANQSNLSQAFLNGFNWVGHEHWHVFLHPVPAGWLRGLEMRPAKAAPPTRYAPVLDREVPA